MLSIEVIRLAKEEGAVLYVSDGKLKCKPGSRGMSDKLIQGIKDNKVELISLLSDDSNKRSQDYCASTEKDEHSSVSYSQSRMYIEHQAGASGALTVPFAFEVDKYICESDFNNGVSETFRKHGILSQGFSLTEKGVKTFALGGQPHTDYVDGAGLSHSSIDEILLSWQNHHFDLEKEIKFRVGLISQKGRSIIMIVTHHICVDGESMKILARDLISSILGVDAEQHSGNEYEFSDFAHNQRAMVERNKKARDYWRDTLKGAPSCHSIPTKNSSNGEEGTKEFSASLTKEQASDFLSFCQNRGLSKFSSLQSMWALCVGSLSYAKDIVIGTPVSGRLDTVDSIVVGPYVNSIPVRTNIGIGQSLRDFIELSSQTFSTAMEHQSLPFEKIIESSGQQRVPNIKPVFQLFFTHTYAHVNGTLEIADVVLKRYSFQSDISRTFDIEVATSETSEGGLNIELVFDSSKFESSLIESLLLSFTSLIKDFYNYLHLDVCELNLFTDSLSLSGKTVPSGEQKHVLECIFDHFMKTPENLAVMDSGNQRISYRDLWDKVAKVSSYLTKNVKGNVVGVKIDRTADLPAVLLGVWHAGKCYVPLDKSYPIERLQYMVTNSGAMDIIIDDPSCSMPAKKHRLDNIFSNEDCSYSLCIPKPESNAYMIYTSGTTGKPKGVKVSHSSMTNFIESMQDLFNFISSDRLLAITPISFDISVLELFLPLFSGGSVYVSSTAEAKNPEKIINLLIENSISFMQATPSTWKLLKAQSNRKYNQLTALSGGESLSASLCDWMKDSFKSAWNMYGPTETTVWSTALDLMSSPLSVGKPILNTSIKVVSYFNQPLPRGAVGELVIGGKGVCNGYHERDELNKHSFINIDGQLFYKTGDLAVIDKNDHVHCLGRIDHQVKINGHRIELQEIDSVIKSVEGVFDVVTDVVASNGNDSLVAFIVAKDNESSGIIEKVKIKVESYLPSFMRPTAIQLIESIPLTPNGKTDRKKLPSLYFPVSKDKLEEKRSEKSPISDLFSQFLGKKVGGSEDFFVNGGDSLTAIRLLNAINDNFDSSITLADFFKSPNVNGISLLIDKSSARRCRVEKAPNMRMYPASSNQKRLWYAHHADSHKGALTMRYQFWLGSDIDVQRLNSAVRELIGNHEILRTVYEHEPKTGDVFQRVLSEFEPCISVSPDIFSNKGDAQSWIDNHSIASFDLQNDLPLRIFIGRVDGGSVVELSLPHIACDAWSVKKITEELLTSYNGKSLIKPKFDYKDYAYWEINQLKSESVRNSLEYWKEFLVDVPAYSSLPLVGNKGFFAGKGFRVRKQLSRSSHEAISKIRTHTGLSDFAILYSVFNVLSSWLSNESKVGISTPVSGRNNIEFQDTLGCFVNSVVLCTELKSETPISEYLSNVKSALESAWEHSSVPFEDVLKNFNHNATNGLVPFSSFVFSSESHTEERGKDAIDSELIGTQALIKLHCDVTPSETTLLWDIDNSASSPELINIYSYYLEELLIFIASDRSKKISSLRSHVIKISSPDVKENEIHTELNVVDSVINYAKEKPNLTAVQCENQKLTYSELLSAAVKVANFLKNECSVKEGDVVATRYSRHSHAIVAALGTLMAGAINMPMEPNQDKNKTIYMLEKSNTKCMLTDLEMDINGFTFGCHSVDSILCKEDKSNIDGLLVSNQSPAFLLFTSGSTGKSKGVLLEHAGVTNAMKSQMKFIQASEKDVFLQYASAGFDAYTAEWLAPLLVGASLCIASNESRVDVRKLELFINEKLVTCIGMTPSSLFYMSPENVPTVRNILVFGESFPPSLIIKWNKKANLFNAYGPTEASICVSMSRVTDQEEVTIGSPFGGVQWEVTNNGEKCPVGVAGELVVIGEAVAAKYLKSTVTGNSGMFRHEPTMLRGYRTGDKVMLTPCGKMLFLGRMTDEFKLMGKRLSLDEIRAGVSDAANNGKSAVLFDEENRIILAFVTESEDIDVVQSVLKRLPHKIIKLEDIPLTMNGKVDYLSLKNNSQKNKSLFIKEPSSDVEKCVLKIWKEVLSNDEIGVNDGIYKVGGNSISLAQIAHACSEHFEVKADLSSFISLNTVEQQSELIEKLISDNIDEDEDDAEMDEFEL